MLVDVDECASADLNECGTVGVTCVNTDPGYNCPCNIGYTPNDDGLTCSGKHHINIQGHTYKDTDTFLMIHIKTCIYKGTPTRIHIQNMLFLSNELGHAHSSRLPYGANPQSINHAILSHVY